jgi:hypothetical protein
MSIEMEPSVTEYSLLPADENGTTFPGGGMISSNKKYPGERRKSFPTSMSHHQYQQPALIKTGGNALVALNQEDQLFKVVVPDGVAPGETIFVRCPGAGNNKKDRMVSVDVPQNSYPGFVFLVQVPPPKPVIVEGIPVHINDVLPTQIVRANIPYDEDDDVLAKPRRDTTITEHSTDNEEEESDIDNEEGGNDEDEEDEYLAFATSDEGSFGAADTSDDDDDFLDVHVETAVDENGEEGGGPPRSNHDLV